MLSSMKSVSRSRSDPVDEAEYVRTYTKQTLEPQVHAGVGALFLPSSQLAAAAPGFVEALQCFDVKQAVHAEITNVQALEQLVMDGRRLASDIYYYRGVANAVLPDAPKGDEAALKQYNERVCPLLEQGHNKMMEAYKFLQKANQLVTKELASFASADSKTRAWTDDHMALITSLIDVVYIIDSLKSRKASLVSDYSHFLRIRGARADDDHAVKLAISQFSFFVNSLRTELHKVDKDLEAVATLMAENLRRVKCEEFVLPQEKFVLIRSVCTLLYMMDVECGGKPADAKRGEKARQATEKALKSVDLDFRKDVCRYLSDFQVVPLIGDFSITMADGLASLSYFNWLQEHVRGLSGDEEVVSRRYKISDPVRLERMRETLASLLCKLQTMITDAKDSSADEAKQRQHAEQLYNVTRTSIQILQSWNTMVTEAITYKYTHPAKKGGEGAVANGQFSNDADDLASPFLNFENALKNNLNDVELSAILEYIAAIKALGRVLLEEEKGLAPMIRRHVHGQIQGLVLSELTNIIARAAKQKKDVEKEMLLDLRNLAADWTNIPDRPVEEQGKESKVKYDFVSKAAAPSVGQLQCIRTTLKILAVQRKGHHGGLFTKKAAIGEKDMMMFNEFLSRSAFWPYALQLHSTVASLVNMGQLWFREFWLDISKTVELFPVHITLPGMLLQNSLCPSNPMRYDLVLTAVDIYNDAAAHLLGDRAATHLWDELSTEAGIAMKQIMERTPVVMYQWLKKRALQSIMDKEWRRTEFDGRVPSVRIGLPTSRLPSLALQTRVQIVDKILDLNKYLSFEMTKRIHADIKTCLQHFFEHGIFCVIELDEKINVIRRLHKLATQFFHLEPFEFFWLASSAGTDAGSMADDVMSFAVIDCFRRILCHAAFCDSTQRFVLGANLVGQEPLHVSEMTSHFYGKDSMHHLLEDVNTVRQGYYGVPHARSLLRLAGTQLPMLINNLTRTMEGLMGLLFDVLSGAAQQFVPRLMVPNTQGRITYGQSGLIYYFQKNLRQLFEFEPLRAEAMQHLRGIGNLLAFAHQLDTASLTDTWQDSLLTMSVLWKGVHPPSSSASDEGNRGINPLASVFRQVPDAVVRDASLRSSGVDHAQKIAQLADQHGRPALLLPGLLRTIREWMGNNEELMYQLLGGDVGDGVPGGVVPDVKSSKEFWRLWSAILFMNCMKPASGQSPDPEVFGDGLHWAGVALMHILGQQARWRIGDFASAIIHTPPTQHSSAGGMNEGDRLEAQYFITHAQEAIALHDRLFTLFDSVFPVQRRPAVAFVPPPYDLQIGARTMSTRQVV